MYLFEEDTTVVPKESSWFAEVNGTEVTDLRDRTIFKEDWLGLKELDKKGGLKFEKTKGDHMTLTEKLLKDVFSKYLGPQSKTFREDTRNPFQGEL
jgi:palmitoyl-protein thioesterase